MHPKIDYHTLPNRNILCIDMKSFYASCAALAKGMDPLTAYLAVVGDTNRRGSVVLAATPALKHDFGIRTGSRLFDIPDHEKIVTVSAQMNLYLQVSAEITRLFNKYVPKKAIYTYSVDESFLDVGGTDRLWESAENVASLIAEELKDTFGLTASIGIGPNMLMAKLCLDLEAKKNGIARWTYADIPEKLWPIQPLSRMWGIGPRLEKRLNRMGIMTVGQLAHFPLERLEKAFGVMGNQLYYHANGVDLSELREPIFASQMSYGKSQILLRDYHKPDDVACVILEMCEEVARRARADRKAGRTIVLGIGYSKTEGGGGFRRSITIETPTNITMEMYHACMHLFRKFYTGKTIRQIAVSLERIYEDRHIQLQLFTKDRAKERKLEFAMDTIRKKYGTNALLRAVSYTTAGTARERNKLVGGHFAE